MAPPNGDQRMNLESRQGPLAQSMNAAVDPLLELYRTGISGMLGLPSFQDAMSADRELAQQYGAFSPERQQAFYDSPLMPMAGTIAGVGKAAGAAGDVAQGIRAYHGSPHTFDQFDMSKFGTGEGGGAYGHGLYFAESEDAARTYRDALSAGQPGSMYQVRINAKADDFLDWDKPLSEQSDVVQGWFEKYRRKLTEQNNGNDPYRYYVPEGKDIIDDVKDLMDDGKINLNDLEEMLSMDAKGAGIAGIRYLDANSRPLSAPTSIGLPETNNYVVFDDKLIEILRRYGLIPPVAAGLGLAATGNNAEAGQ